MPRLAAFVFVLRRGAVVVSAHLENGEPHMCVLVDEGEDGTEERRFRLAKTGEPLEESDLTHVATFLARDGSPALHLFEMGRVST